LPASFFYVLSLFFFALGLMCKPVLVTLPFVLLLLDYWPLGRIMNYEGGMMKDGGLTSRPRSYLIIHNSPFIIREKVPFFVLAGVSSLIMLAAHQGLGMLEAGARIPLDLRLENAVVSYAQYLGKTIWPFNLATFYPLRSAWPMELLALSGLLLAGVSALAVWAARSRPWLAVGWFWFLGVLVPFIGLIQAGAQGMADRFMYVPLIGLFIPVVWGAAEVVGRLGWARKWTVAVVSLILVLCALRTADQLRYWQNTEMLFQHALAVTRDNYMAHNNLAGDYYLRGKLDEAIEHYQASLAILPTQPSQLVIHYYIGEALNKRGRYAEAAEQLTEVLRVQPDNVAALEQLGIARARQGKAPEAEQAFTEALRLQPDDAGAHNSFGNVLAQQGRHEEAVRQFEEALRLKPGYAGALNNLAISCKKLGRIGEAIAHYREAIRMQPDSVEAINNLAWILAAQPEAKFRNGTEAVELATRACELTKYQNPIALATVAAAYGEAGKFPEAISFAEQAQALTAGRNGPVAARLKAMLEAFHAGQAFREE
jgi:tetratricopeptide (TPR) repeat protein